MLNTQLPGLYILEDTKRGRGVFCSEMIAEGSIIELCPVIILSAEDTEAIHNTRLHDYYFMWNVKRKESCIAVGYGSLYNHSDQPNAEFENDYDARMIKITALHDINAHSEITIEYLSKDEKEYKLWF